MFSKEKKITLTIGFSNYSIVLSKKKKKVIIA